MVDERRNVGAGRGQALSPELASDMLMDWVEREIDDMVESFLTPHASDEEVDQLREAFARLIPTVEIGPEDLENKVLFAEYYATFAQDRALFEKLLKDVLAVPEDFGPQELKLDNAEARRRAKRLLEKADEIF